MNRATLAFALTTCLLVGAEAVVVVLILAAFQHSELGVILAVVVGVAVAWPLWRWLDPRVRELFDRHEQPYDALVSVAPESSAASTIARAVDLPYVAVEMRGEVVEHGRPIGSTLVRVPIVFDGETLGEVRAGARRTRSALTAADLRLLEDLSAQLALTSMAREAAVRLAESRTQIVTAREEERARLRRDLHDGLAPSLASVQLQLGALQRRLPDGEHPAVGELIDDVQRIFGDLRRIVYDLRPPLLDDLGFAGALTRQIAGVSRPTVVIDVPDTSLPSAVEVAMFRVASEAVRNAIRHSGADHVRAQLTVDGTRALLDVSDDGNGLPPDVVHGVGLTSMRDRCEELGGTLQIDSTEGVHVRATIPLEGGSR